MSGQRDGQVAQEMEHFARRVELEKLPKSGPYRIFLYHLKKNMLLLTLDVDAMLNTTVELKDAVYTALDSAVGATIRR